MSNCHIVYLMILLCMSGIHKYAWLQVLSTSTSPDKHCYHGYQCVCVCVIFFLHQCNHCYFCDGNAPNIKSVIIDYCVCFATLLSKTPPNMNNVSMSYCRLHLGWLTSTSIRLCTTTSRVPTFLCSSSLVFMKAC